MCNSSLDFGNVENVMNLFPDVVNGAGGDDLAGLLSSAPLQNAQCETFIQENLCAGLGLAQQGLCNAVATQICAGVNICDSDVYDERNSSESKIEKNFYFCSRFLA